MSGKKDFCKKSNGGAYGLWVPPSSTSLEGPSASSGAAARSGGRVWRCRGPHGKVVDAGQHGLRREPQALRAEGQPLGLRRGDPRGSLRRGQVLPHQAGPLAPGADLCDLERLAGHQGQRRAQHLTAALALRAVYVNHFNMSRGKGH